MRWAAVAALVALAGAAALIPPRQPAASGTLPARAAAASNGPRVWFTPQQRAALALPDGSTRPVRSLLRTGRAMRFGEYRWDARDVPPGTAWVRIDLARQIISVFRGPHEIGTAVILYGTDGKPTPSGTFRVLARAARYRSRTYDADMPFMLRLTDDGVAIHASAVKRGSATHGCIGVPAAFAERLFAEMRRGDLVAILPARGVA